MLARVEVDDPGRFFGATPWIDEELDVCELRGLAVGSGRRRASLRSNRRPRARRAALARALQRSSGLPVVRSGSTLLPPSLWCLPTLGGRNGRRRIESPAESLAFS